MKEHIETNEHMPKKRRPAIPIARECMEILDMKNDKHAPTLLEFKEIVGPTNRLHGR